MSKLEKLIRKLKAVNGELKWTDLAALLIGLGFEQIEGAGSRVKFVKAELIISLHKPHPQKEVKCYVVRQVRETLEREGLI